MIRNLEELELERNENRRFYTAENAFDGLNDRQFIKKFRLPKENVRDLIHELSPFMIHPTRRSSISIERKVLTALRFYASGSYQQDIGENRASSMSQSAVSQCITEVTEALNQPLVFSKHVYFPRTIEELNIVRQ
ncbi:putative nuclease HARBI1, partial [Aphis craccivora]